MKTVVNDRVDEEKKIWSLLDGIPDPEIPVLSVNDLGIARKVTVLLPNKHVKITITPTYSGCPAMDVISSNIKMTLHGAGYEKVEIEKVLSPAWTTDWMSETGKEKLKAYGIAPPTRVPDRAAALFSQGAGVQCPLCNSNNTHMISEFGSTSCKALYRCNECHEPFDVFKCH